MQNHLPTPAKDEIALLPETLRLMLGLRTHRLQQPFDAGQALATAVAEAREVALAAPMAVHYAKVAASRGGEIDFHSGYALDIAAYNVLVSSQDRLEGVRAFNEKRPPRWSGR
mgnify:CR=1 FL=1